MKNPYIFIFDGELKLVHNTEIAQPGIVELAKNIVVVAGNIHHLNTFFDHFHQLTDHFQMSFWKIISAKPPRIDNVAIQNQSFGLNGFQILEKVFGFAGHGCQVNVGND